MGERVITDSLAVQGVIFFSTFNPIPTGVTRDACNNLIRCEMARGLPRIYRVSTRRAIRIWVPTGERTS